MTTASDVLNIYLAPTRYDKNIINNSLALHTYKAHRRNLKRQQNLKRQALVLNSSQTNSLQKQYLWVQYACAVEGISATQNVVKVITNFYNNNKQWYS